MEEQDKEFVAEMGSKRDYSYDAPAHVFYAADPEFGERYDDYAEYVLRRDGVLSRKNRELIIIAFAAAENRPEACRNHIAAAFKYGAKLEEVLQTFQLTGQLAGAWSRITAARALDDIEVSLANLDVDLEELAVDLDELDEYISTKY